MKLKILSGPPLVEVIDGKRLLSRELIVDLGEIVHDLEFWAEDRKLDSTARGADYRVRRGDSGLSTYLRVPPGFRYDGASIPFWAHPIMGAKENYEAAGCFHDALYRWQADRDVADSVFWLIARAGSRHVNPTRAWLGWAALRMGGWVAHRRYRVSDG